MNKKKNTIFCNTLYFRSQKWEMDEAAVRAGTCQFYVKYLGAIEVFESRGMQVVYINSVQGRSERIFLAALLHLHLAPPFL